MNKLPELGRLERVNLRDYWINEATYFTPWLAFSENLNLLSDTVGMEFELMDTEEPELIERLSQTATDSSHEAYFFGKAQLYDLMKQPDFSRIYYDSARVIIEEKIRTHPQNDYDLYAELGLAYAFLGEKDRAIEESTRAKELMSIEDCHW